MELTQRRAKPAGVNIQFLFHTIVGSVPKNKANIKIPNAKPGVRGKSMNIRINVNGIVILKKKTDKHPQMGDFQEKNARIAAALNDKITDRSIPAQSARKPPAIFPPIMHNANSSPIKKSVFHG